MLIDGTRPAEIAETLQLTSDDVERSIARILEAVETKLNLRRILASAAEA
jgi:DNA-directed RNA polymerase specialized sigma24 family protein